MSRREENEHWVGTWACSPQWTEPDNMPPEPGLTQHTLRQIVQVSIGGNRLRVRFSNEYGRSTLSIARVGIARSHSGSAISISSSVTLAFAGRDGVDIAPGTATFSDPFEYALEPMTRLAVTIHFAQCPAEVTGHPGSRTTSYIADTDRTTDERFLDSIDTVHWYFLTGIDVWKDRQHRAIVTLGDSLTDGRGSTTDGHDRWPDFLSRRLRAFAPTATTAILNHGIGGNSVLEGGLGPTAIQRFERDVLDQPGVRFVILLEGVNDIGTSPYLSTVADRLIAAFGNFIEAAHERSIWVYGATILPFQGSQYSGDEQERVRRTVNDWIRNGGRFDAVIDFAQAVADPQKRDILMTDFDCEDHLHLNPKGYRRLAESIDLKLFVR